METTAASRRGRKGIFVALLSAMTLVIASGTAYADYVEDGGPLPAEVTDIFADCPELPDGVSGLICLNLTAYDGQLNLGSTEANVSDPIEVKVAVGLGPGFTAVIVPAEGDGSPPAPINVPGGLLGIPELDPILALDPLGVLTVSATPTLGGPTVGRPGQDPLVAGVGFLGWSVGLVTDDPAAANFGPTSTEDYLADGGSGIGLPLSIQLNNLLFGDNCQIGTPEEPIVINLTNATTEPPEGVDPISGEVGEGFATVYDDGFTLYGGVTGSVWVDNTFAVPAATNCDLLGTGILDPVVNSQVGLPSGAGANAARFTIDSHAINYGAIHP